MQCDVIAGLQLLLQSSWFCKPGRLCPSDLAPLAYLQAACAEQTGSFGGYCVGCLCMWPQATPCCACKPIGLNEHTAHQRLMSVHLTLLVMLMVTTRLSLHSTNFQLQSSVELFGARLPHMLSGIDSSQRAHVPVVLLLVHGGTLVLQVASRWFVWWSLASDLSSSRGCKSAKYSAGHRDWAQSTSASWPQGCMMVPTTAAAAPAFVLEVMLLAFGMEVA